MIKTCRMCEEPKDDNEFGVSVRHKNGKNTACRVCSQKYRDSWVASDPVRKELYRLKDLKSKRDWYAKNKVSVRLRRKFENYGLTPEQFVGKMKEQGNACKICLTLFDESHPPNVDHDHACCPGTRSCGKCVRGILCNNCNHLLGNARDSEVCLERALVYLATYQRLRN